MDFIPSDWNKINTSLAVTPTVPSLADCPWPPDNTGCSPLCAIWLPDDSGKYHVWGEKDGDTTRKRFHAQTFCVNNILKNLTFKVNRARSTPVPDGDGLFVGIVDMDTLNDPAKLYDPSQWEWAGYLATLPGGEPEEHYYVCNDMDLTLDVLSWWFLLMVTNGSYEICGWRMSGFHSSTFPEGIIPLWVYTKNEPGISDGWETLDNYYRGCVIPYTLGAGAVDEGFCQIDNPNFPSAAQEGTPYQYSFNIDQLTAFPCGCPETIAFQLFNRDDDVPLGDATLFDLECGYSIASIEGLINFSGTGIFHGQLKVGHKTNGQWVVDDTHDFDVTLTGLPCSDHTNKTDCENAGCWWWNNSCHDDQPTACSLINNEADCTSWGCYWCNGQCQNTPCNGGQGIITDYYANPNPLPPEGGSSTAYVTGKNMGASSAYFILSIWTSQHGDSYSDAQELAPGNSMSFNTLLTNIIQNTNVQFMLWYWNGTDWELHDEIWPYVIEVQAGDVIGDIIESGSTYYTGPFAPGEFQIVANVLIKNIGTMGGILNYNLYQYPGTPQESIVVPNQYYFNAGQQLNVGFNATIPNIPGQIWPLGIKVWGEGETEPSMSHMFNIKL